MPKKMLVEMTGLPGSGKSTVSDSVCVRSNVASRNDYKAFVTNMNAVQKIVTLIYFMLKNSKLIFQISIFVLLNWKEKTAINRTLKFVAYSAYIDKFIKDSESSLYLFDQGLVQLLWSIMLYTRNEKMTAMNNVVKLLEKKYNLVNINLELDINTAITRMKQREFDGCTLDLVGRSEIEKMFSKNAYNFDLLLKSITENKKMTIKAEQPVDESVAHIAEFLKEVKQD